MPTLGFEQKMLNFLFDAMANNTKNSNKHNIPVKFYEMWLGDKEGDIV